MLLLLTYARMNARSVKCGSMNVGALFQFPCAHLSTADSSKLCKQNPNQSVGELSVFLSFQSKVRSARTSDMLVRCLGHGVGQFSRPAFCDVLPGKHRDHHTMRRQATHKQHAVTHSSVTRSTAAGTNLTEVAVQLDRCLAIKDDSEGEKQALALLSTMVEDGTLRGFGKAQQVPKRSYTIEELRLNQISAEKLLSPKDESLNFVRTVAQVAAASGVAVLSYANHWDAGQTIASVLSIAFLFTLDQVVNQGGGEALVVDTLGRVLQPSYGRRVALHESGHFLVAYLIGILPRAYTLSSLDTFRRYGVLNVQAGCQFCDSAFGREVFSGKLGSGSLDRYTCVALAGVVTEYLRFGQAEGGLGDVQQIDGMYKALQFTQKKADSELRWAVLNTALVLRRHEELHNTLADAMSRGESVGTCIAVIEKYLETAPDTV